MKKYESFEDTLDDLRQRGYDADFDLQSNCLYCNNLDLRLYEEEFQVDEVYHFQRGSNLEGNTDVYALTSPTGVKGIVMDGRGASSENNLFEMVQKPPNHPTMQADD